MALPSTVVDRKFISIPPEEDLVGREGWERCGKWILTSSEIDMRSLDRTWNALQPLLRDGTLLMLKSSTAKLRNETAVIQCFVREGKEEAKRTARIIRDIVHFDGIMYYKVNKLTQEDVARRYGHKHVSIYMHTYLGRFYVRSGHADWILEEDTQKDVCISPRFLRENYSEESEEDLPSLSNKTLVNLPSSSKGLENWYLKCSLSESKREYLPGADRAWIVAKELLARGHFVGISWCKNARGVEVRLHVRKGSDPTSQLAVCDELRKSASVDHVMYFHRGNEGNIKYSYKYTAEGELYQQTEFAEKFVLHSETALKYNLATRA